MTFKWLFKCLSWNKYVHCLVDTKKYLYSTFFPTTFQENILNPPTSINPSSIELYCLDSSSKPSTSSSDPDSCKQFFDTSNPTTICSKRKSVDGEQPEPGVCKKPCISPSSPIGSVLLQEVAEQDEALRSRMLQEEEDRRLALRLQKELNREIAVDRRKGSVNEYLLREKISPSSSPDEDNEMDKASIPHSSRQKVDGHKVGKRDSSQVEWKNFKKSSVSTQVSPSSATSVQKSRKQATLTEMFPSLGS